ncbi:MAG: hypothetical protein U1D30_00010 [Planctomycetota bacterium]
MQFVASKSQEQLEAELVDGRTHLAVIDQMVVPRLVHAAAIFANPQVDYGSGIVISAIDVGRVFQNTLAAIEKMNQPASAE